LSQEITWKRETKNQRKHLIRIMQKVHEEAENKQQRLECQLESTEVVKLQ